MIFENNIETLHAWLTHSIVFIKASSISHFHIIIITDRHVEQLPRILKN